MIIKALLQFKQLLSRPKQKAIALFKVQTEFVNPKVNTNPNFLEIKVTIEKFFNSIIDCSKNFYRWKDGTCICVEPSATKVADKELGIHTYYEDINKNRVITSIVAEISNIRKATEDRVDKSKEAWQINKDYDDENYLDGYRKGLWDPKHRSKIDKNLEKNSSTNLIEFNLETFEILIKEYQENIEEIDVDFMRVDFTKVKAAFIKQAKERLVRIGLILVKISEKDVEELQKKIFFYHDEIKKDEDSRAKLKKCLNMLAEIRD